MYSRWMLGGKVECACTPTCTPTGAEKVQWKTRHNSSKVTQFRTI